jgi:hypothetical protein
MTAKNNLTTQPLLVKRALIGTGIGLAIILFFVLGVKNPKPEWGQYWMVRPIIVTPIVVALAGACTSFLDSLRHEGGIKQVIAYVLTTGIYLFGLWIGIIAGLAGTLWD